MNEKNRVLINEFLDAVPIEYKEIFNELAEYAIQLGYTPKRTTTKNFGIDFSKRKVRKTIMKFEDHDNGIPSRNPGLRLRYYASSNYSEIFKNGVKRVIEEKGGKNTGCRRCGDCKGKLEGYIYTYPNGKNVFRCGPDQMIEIYDFGMADVPEIKSLLKTQDEHLINKVKIATGRNEQIL